MNKPKEMMGVVKCKDKNVVFHHRDYTFSFMSNEIPSLGESIRARLIEANQEDGFVQCVTENMDSLLFWTNNSKITMNQRLRTTLLISECNTIKHDDNFFDGISFIGGTLNKVYYQDAVQFDYLNDNQIVGNLKDDSRTYYINENSLQCTITIRTRVLTNRSVNDGESITNNGVELSLFFKEKQKLSSLFDYYLCMKRILSFLCFRENVNFDSIHLLQNTELHGHQLSLPIFEVFIPQEENSTQKNIMQNICIPDLGESFSKLFCLFYNHNENEPTFSLNFYPKSDEEASIMTTEKLRFICSGLECELEHQSLEKEKETELENLKDQIKSVIKEHRRKSTTLQPKTYEMMFGSIKNWSFSLNDKIIALYNKFKPEMEILIANGEFIFLDEEKIGDFIKYRNKTTHGYNKELTREIALTAHYLSGLVYLCLLERIGVEQETRERLCKENRIIKY